MTTKKQEKDQLREKFRVIRRKLHSEINNNARDLVATNFIQFVPNVPTGTVVAAYYPMGSEIDSLRLLATLQINGIRLALPVVWKEGEAMEFRAYKLGDALEEGAHDTLQPKADAPVLNPEILIIPLMAFDEKGYRLGQGGGYYDRTLAKIRAKKKILAIGLAFDGQKTKSLPVEKFDEPLDGVLTEKGLWNFRKPGK